MLVAPLYWYGIPAAAKLYLDHWSRWMRLDEADFRARVGDKALWLVMSYASDRPEQILPAVGQCRFAIEFFGGIWRGRIWPMQTAPGKSPKIPRRWPGRILFLVICPRLSGRSRYQL